MGLGMHSESSIIPSKKEFGLGRTNSHVFVPRAVPQTKELETTGIYSLIVLDARHPISRC